VSSDSSDSEWLAGLRVARSSLVLVRELSTVSRKTDATFWSGRQHHPAACRESMNVSEGVRVREGAHREIVGELSSKEGATCSRIVELPVNGLDGILGGRAKRIHRIDRHPEGQVQAHP